MNTKKNVSFSTLPSTYLGWASFGLLVTFVIMYVGHLWLIDKVYANPEVQAQWGTNQKSNIWIAWQFYYYSMWFCVGPAAAILAFLAIIGKRERSPLVWLVVVIFLALLMMFACGIFVYMMTP